MCPESVFVVLVVVLGRRRVEFPSLLVTVADLLFPLQLLVVFVLDAERLTDVVDDVLVGGGVVAARRFVADRICRFPVGVDFAAGDGRARFRVIVELLRQLAAPAAGGRRRAVQI